MENSAPPTPDRGRSRNRGQGHVGVQSDKNKRRWRKRNNSFRQHSKANETNNSWPHASDKTTAKVVSESTNNPHNDNGDGRHSNRNQRRPHPLNRRRRGRSNSKSFNKRNRYLEPVIDEHRAENNHKDADDKDATKPGDDQGNKDHDSNLRRENDSAHGENNRSKYHQTDDGIVLVEPPSSSSWKQHLLSPVSTLPSVPSKLLHQKQNFSQEPRPSLNIDHILVICFDLESALGSTLGEIWQLGAVASLPCTSLRNMNGNSHADADADADADDDKVQPRHSNNKSCKDEWNGVDTAMQSSNANIEPQANKHRFLSNLLPQGNIHFGVTKYSGTNVTIHTSHETKQRYLWHTKKRQCLNSVSQYHGLAGFLDWIENCRHNLYQELIAEKKRSEEVDDKVSSDKHVTMDENRTLRSRQMLSSTVTKQPISRFDVSPMPIKVVLVSHGGDDMSSLLNSLSYYNLLYRFTSLVDGFADSMPYLNVSISAAYERLFPEARQTFEAHNALEDAEALFKVLCLKQRREPVMSQSLSAHSVSTTAVTPSKKDLSVSPTSMRLVFDIDQLGDSFLGTRDAIEYSKYRVTKSAQKFQPVGGVKPIMSLIAVEPTLLDKCKFVNAYEEGGDVGSRSFGFGRIRRIDDWPPVAKMLVATPGISMTFDNNAKNKDTIKGLTASSESTAIFLHPDAASNSPPCIAFDVQFLHSVGIRSNLVRLSAVLLGNHNFKASNGEQMNQGRVSDHPVFDASCVPPCEMNLFRPRTDLTTLDALKSFLDWLDAIKEKNDNTNLILFGYGIFQRKWPGLLNHLDYFGREYVVRLACLVDGVCDISNPIKKANNNVKYIINTNSLTKNNSDDSETTNSAAPWNAANRCDNIFGPTRTQEKVHKLYFPNSPKIEMYRSLDLIESSCMLATELANRYCTSELTDNNETNATSKPHKQYVSPQIIINSNALTFKCARRFAKYLLDQSLAADIAAGIDFERGCYDGHRLSPEYC